MRLLCRFLGHSFIIIETQGWGVHRFSHDEANMNFLGYQAIKLWCQRCGHRIDEVGDAIQRDNSHN